MYLKAEQAASLLQLSELEFFEETHRQSLTESSPQGCCKSADLAVKLPRGSSEAARGKKI